MPSSLTPFAFGEHLVRSITDENGDPWFVAKDVALALDYQWNGFKNVQHIPNEWRRVESVSTHSRGEQETWLLSEQGLYFFLGRSDKPRALPFQKWLAGEVLPTLRKSGTYTLPGEHKALPGKAVLALDDLPPDVLDMNRKLRERCLSYSLQMARLTGLGGEDELRESFIACCRMFMNDLDAPCEDFYHVARFVRETCERGPFETGTQKFWLAFKLWAPEVLGTEAAEFITMKRLAMELQKVPGLRVIRRNPVILFSGIRLRAEWRKKISGKNAAVDSQS